ncbi:VNN [Lepeophtheirus salmonis]|uniref:VNN n=1 Tax=Lepeophtheirus salmonis TaxID=72036 RepID=A0A7R8CW08_LEPSM|nr:VNN [Lepeophtheirus salmonis]CAF2948124.1 VNN [Lepeophtheirus salmonis]
MCSCYIRYLLTKTLVLIMFLAQVLKYNSYIASVVEFESAEVRWEDLKNDPMSYISQNMEQLRSYVLESKNQGSDIIIFPDQILPEDIPQKKSLCFDSESNSLDNLLLRNLSCIAAENQIYLHSNTNVAFDRRGRVIARYRKFNTYHEPVVNNELSEPDISYFDTDFGARIGLMTCFDILFDKPSKGLLAAGVDAIAFPTAWMDELPFLTAIGYHPGAARMLNTTILSSGHHYLKSGATGSGIYSPDRVIKYTWNDVPKVITSKVDSSETFSHGIEVDKEPKLNLEDLHGYMFMNIPNGEGSLRINANGTNCNLEYSLRLADFPSESGYVFMGKKGERTFGGTYPYVIQSCEATFDRISLSGSFDKGVTPAPVSLNHDYRPFMGMTLMFDCDSTNRCHYSNEEPLTNLYTFGLYGVIQ